MSRNNFIQLNNNLSNINVYVGEDEKLHFVDSTGADSALPFSSGLEEMELVYNNKTFCIPIAYVITDILIL